MQLLRLLICYTLGLLALSLPLTAQTFVYSGREYLKVNRSWSQIREMNLATGRRVQLTANPRDHWRPWCAPDGRSILFTSSPPGGEKLLSRFDRITKKETPLITLEQDLFQVVAALDRSNIIVQEYGSVIEFIDIAKNHKVRRVSGLNPVLAPNRMLVAWQTPVDIMARSNQTSHILLSDLNGDSQIDLGEGAAPAFSLDGVTLLFVRLDSANHQYDLVRYNTRAKSQEVQRTKNTDFFAEASDLSVSPGGSATVVSTNRGRYGSAQYWRLGSNMEWTFVEENLGPWGGWSLRSR